MDHLENAYPQYAGHERRMSSNVLSFPCFHPSPESEADIMIYGNVNAKRTGMYINRRFVDVSDVNLPKYKIVVPKADGNGTFGDVITLPEILPPNSGFTHTFLGIGGFDTWEEAKAALKYIKTRMVRTLLGVLKVTQDVNADKWTLVPLQDFTSASDIDWTEPVAQIDQQLYKKYGLSDEEAGFIEAHVKEMN
jgi:type II restriction enzyme